MYDSIVTTILKTIALISLVFSLLYFIVGYAKLCRIVVEKSNQPNIEVVQADNTNSTNIVIDSTEETSSTTNNIIVKGLKFIVEVNEIQDNNIIGATATLDNYSGIIRVETNNTTGIYAGNTYVINAEPLITMEDVPTIKAVSIVQATQEDKDKLEQIREKISNYLECRYKYETMSLTDIILDGNKNYPYWTEAEKRFYIDFIEKKGYTDEYIVKSLVKSNE